MITGLQWVADAFLVPQDPATSSWPLSASAASDGSEFAVLLGSPGQALGGGAAVANELRRRSGCQAACLLLWQPSTAQVVGSRPSTPGASRLAAWLTARGLAGTARGRLALAFLPADPEPAATTAWRILAAVECPAVVAIAGPRPHAFGSLVREAALVALAEVGDPRLLALALDELGDRSGEIGVLGRMAAMRHRTATLGWARAGALLGPAQA